MVDGGRGEDVEAECQEDGEDEVEVGGGEADGVGADDFGYEDGDSWGVGDDDDDDAAAASDYLLLLSVAPR
jgi:hypothetical protein